MDMTKVFDTLDRRIEKLLERLERDQDAVRERLEKLIATLEAAEKRP